MSLSDLFTGTQVEEFTKGQANNPLFRQAQIQIGNQQYLNDLAKSAYERQMTTPMPQQNVAAFDPIRQQGLNTQLGVAQNILPQFLNQGLTAAGGLQSGIGAGQNALQRIAGGQGPQFDQGMASGVQNFMTPQLLGAQQALANQANLNWNKGIGAAGGLGSGFMSSGRNSAVGQAMENASTSLGNQQQMLALDAARTAANAGVQGGLVGSQQQLQAGQTLGQQGLGSLALQNQLASGMLLPGQVQEAAGTTQQQQQQNELNAQFMNELNQFQNPFRSLQNLQAGLGVLGSSNYAPNMAVPNNVMSLLQMFGMTLPQVLSGGFDFLSNYLGGKAMGGEVGMGQTAMVGERAPEYVNGQLYPRPTLIQGPASVVPAENIGKPDFSAAWADL